ncbi:hypothetical protein BU15DRAFT_60935 [Melanogaster broomeanus]|nr:hypothetical protein BU15DRAFT_60935 [Melanogaster broomeanus]
MPNEILNPVVYLNYLDPAVANEYEVSRNALTWDILSSLPEDWKIARTSKPTPVLFAYFLARICALVVVLGGVLMMTGPVAQCEVLALNVIVVWVIASAASSYLFLKRVHAVFLQDRNVWLFFTFLWLTGFGTSFLSLADPLHEYYEFADTKHCISRKVEEYQSIAFIVPGLFDTLVFLAVTYKILMSHRVSTPRSWRAFWCGEALPRLSRAVLQGGQQYYMITAGINVTRAVVTLLPSASPVLQRALTPPALAVTSVMACRVFRNLRLAALQQRQIGALDTMPFVHIGSASVNIHRPKSGDDATPDTDFKLEMAPKRVKTPESNGALIDLIFPTNEARRTCCRTARQKFKLEALFITGSYAFTALTAVGRGSRFKFQISVPRIPNGQDHDIGLSARHSCPPKMPRLALPLLLASEDVSTCLQLCYRAVRPSIQLTTYCLLSGITSEKILNHPSVYLNYLQSTIASDYEVAKNVDLATLGALTWDILSSLPGDWQIVRTSKVHAVFLQDRIVCHFFTFLWLAAFGASLVVLPFSLHDYYEIANTKRCINHQIKGYVSAAFIVLMIFDALVFLAITYKILMS